MRAKRLKFTISFSISLIQTRERIPINNVNIAIIKMPSERTGGDIDVTITGWGFTDWSWEIPQQAPNQLQRLSKVTLTNEECKRRMPGNEHLIPDHKICTFTRRGEGEKVKN